MKHLQAVLLFILLGLSSCVKIKLKDPGSAPPNTIVEGYVYEAGSKQSVAGLPVELYFRDGDSHSMGLNLSSFTIANVVTDASGHYRFAFAARSGHSENDEYLLRSFGAENYFGFTETLPCNEVDGRPIRRDFEVMKRIVVRVKLVHGGPPNPDDNIRLKIASASGMLYYSSYTSGDKAETILDVEVVAEQPAVFTYTIRRDSAYSAEQRDTVTFRTNGEEHKIDF